MKVDIRVDDGINVISQTSYVFPTRLLQLNTSYSSDSFDQPGMMKILIFTKIYISYFNIPDSLHFSPSLTLPKMV